MLPELDLTIKMGPTLYISKLVPMLVVEFYQRNQSWSDLACNGIDSTVEKTVHFQSTLSMYTD